MAPRLWSILLLAGCVGATSVAAAQTGVDVGAVKSRADTGKKTQVAAAPASADSGATGDVSETTVMRETFAYGGASRDPFASLIKTAHAGPELVDLQLVGIYEDLRYSGNSIAVLREKSTGKRYKLRAGEQIGRLRVMQVRSKDVVFTIQDFGYERQETLSLRKLEDVTP
ncbi:MAG TPA: hypothetical protein VK688_03370 [Gemmatimonadales bacterium]|nr:hypothetical protein [Gemmatimonadales bacterium]